MHTIFKKISLFTLVIVFLSSISAGNAFADTTVQNSGLTSNSSLNWAGYVSTGNVYTAVNGTWNIPVPTVPATNASMTSDATWVGIGGVTGGDLIQTGTQAVIQNGQIIYQAWVETLPNYQQIIPVTVHGGDSVTASLNEQSSNQWLISFTDNTTNQNYQQVIDYTSSQSSAEWIEEMPADVSSRGRTSFLPLDNFGSVQFTNGNTTFNGNQTTIVGSGAQPLTMVFNNNTLATPSSLSSDGGGFSVTRSNTVISNNLPSPSQSNTPTQGRGWRTGVGIQGYTRPSRTNNRSYTRRINITIVPSSFKNFTNEINMRFIRR
jgi:hypothetical protein